MSAPYDTAVYTAGEFARDVGTTPFETRILAMNTRYELPVNQSPSLVLGEPVGARLAKFKRALQKELDEIDVILYKVSCWETGATPLWENLGETYKTGPRDRLVPPVDPTQDGTMEPWPVDELEILTDIADLGTDLQVYILSEMAKFGIPQLASFNIVMDSNESKLDDDGKPTKDGDGKFLKGPNYWKPEPKLRSMLEMFQTLAPK